MKYTNAIINTKEMAFDLEEVLFIEALSKSKGWDSDQSRIYFKNRESIQIEMEKDELIKLILDQLKGKNCECPT